MIIIIIKKNWLILNTKIRILITLFSFFGRIFGNILESLSTL